MAKHMQHYVFIGLMTVALGLFGGSAAYGQDSGEEPYAIRPGDVLEISVWKEPELLKEVLVRPDGGITFPLAGDMAAAGRSVEQVRVDLVQRLNKFIPDPVVTVGVKLLNGNRIYVLGKVNRPGEFPIVGKVDVMQALSMAGGTGTFAAPNKIIVLRREGTQQVAIPFRYAEVESGENLEQNILLRSGDIVVVP